MFGIPILQFQNYTRKSEGKADMATKRTLGEVMQSLSTQPDPKTTFILQIAAQIAENKKNRRGVLSSACLFFALRETQLEYSKLPMAKPSQVGSRGAPLDDFCDFIYTKDSKKYIQWKKNYFGDPEGDLDYKIKDKFELELGSNTPEILITASRLSGENFSQDHFSPEHLIASLIFNGKAKVNQGRGGTGAIPNTNWRLDLRFPDR